MPSVWVKILPSLGQVLPSESSRFWGESSQVFARVSQEDFGVSRVGGFYFSGFFAKSETRKSRVLPHTDWVQVWRMYSDSVLI